jgi:hypothetical protein
LAGKKIVKLVTAIIVFALVGAGVYIRNTRDTEPGLVDLPDGVLARASELQVTRSDLDAFLESLPEKQREIKSRDPEGALQTLIEKRLLLAEASRLPEEFVPDMEGKSAAEAEALALKALREWVTRDIRTPEAKVREYYEEHRQEYDGKEGGSYEEMHDSIEQYLRWYETEIAYGEYRKSLVEKAGVEKDRSWVLEARVGVKDPLIESRMSGKVVVADFGRGI